MKLVAMRALAAGLLWFLTSSACSQAGDSGPKNLGPFPEAPAGAQFLVYVDQDVEGILLPKGTKDAPLKEIGDAIELALDSMPESGPVAILIAPGTYEESLYIETDKLFDLEASTTIPLYLKGYMAGDAPEEVVLESSGDDVVFVVGPGGGVPETPVVHLSGLKIIAADEASSGISVFLATMSIRDCLLVGSWNAPDHEAGDAIPEICRLAYSQPHCKTGGVGLSAIDSGTVVAADLTIQGFKGEGVRLQNSPSQFERCLVQENGKTGISAIDSAQTVITDCTITANYLVGLYVDRTDLILQGSSISDNLPARFFGETDIIAGHGVAFFGAQQYSHVLPEKEPHSAAIENGNEISGNHGVGLYLSDLQGSVTSNTITQNTLGGIFLQRSVPADLEASHLMTLELSPFVLDISENTVLHNGELAILVAAGEQANIKGNDVGDSFVVPAGEGATGWLADGIIVAFSAAATVGGNTFRKSERLDLLVDRASKETRIKPNHAEGPGEDYKIVLQDPVLQVDSIFNGDTIAGASVEVLGDENDFYSSAKIIGPGGGVPE